MGAAHRTPFIGLTGAIAAGKSEALAALERLGAATLSSDAVVHELLATDRVRDLLVERWGAEVAPGGAVDRDPGRRDRLRATRGARVARAHSASAGRRADRGLAQRRCRRRRAAAVVEVPLLFETGMEDAFDATIAVVAADETRAERARRARHSRAGGRASAPALPG